MKHGKGESKNRIQSVNDDPSRAEPVTPPYFKASRKRRGMRVRVPKTWVRRNRRGRTSSMRENTTWQRDRGGVKGRLNSVGSVRVQDCRAPSMKAAGDAIGQGFRIEGAGPAAADAAGGAG